MNTSVLVSTRLFPLPLLNQVIDKLADQIRCQVVPTGDQVVRVELERGLGLDVVERGVLLFKRELTSAVFRSWRGAQAPVPLPVQRSRPRTVTVLMPEKGVSTQVRRSDGRVQIILTIEHDQVEWSDLVGVLCSLEGVDVTMDSLWPADRYVVLLELHAGRRPDQVLQQVFADLLGS